MEILPASYYGTIDKSNPVISAFERNLNEFKSYMKKVRDSPSFDHFSYSRGSLKLFDIWNKYEPRLPSLYYEERLLHIADFLLENKFYKLALWQCFRPYLHRFTMHSLESIKDVEHFKQEFFPQGFRAAGAKFKFRALQGECTCAFHLERERCKLLNHAGMQKLLSILAFLRIMMQAILPQEHLSWILYNGSLSIYNICRFLMSVGHAAQALEYLLWACVCLETSVPLLTPSFLTWRTTLYCAVCECYYDGQAAVQAEVFARRALGKISELGKLVEMSGTPSSPETQQAFKEATVKLAVMVFKRSVYETRRKPKEFFRLKQKSSLKEGNSNPWPRTVTERILMELFEGNAAQFLAVLEALWDSSRRPLETGTPDEMEIHEVALELMSAGISILSGNGGSSDRVRNDSLPPTLAAITPAFTIMEMATAGENQIPVDAAVKFVKLLFRYEQWDVFCSLSDNLVTVLSNLESHPFHKAELELTVLNAVVHLALTHRVHLSSKDVKVQVQMDKDKTTELISMTDEILNLVQTLHMCVCNAAENNQPDGDLVQDIVLFLWAKCKLVFQKAQTRHYDQVRYVDKMENRDKWVQTLFVLCEVAHVCQLADRDLLAVADMTLRLAMVLESNAYAHALSGIRQASNENNSLSTPEEEHDTTPIMNNQVKQLEMACAVLERGLTCISRGRTVAVPSDASAICDTVYLQKPGGTHMRLSGERELESSSISCGSSLYMDLHIELMAFHHRLSLKLLDFYPDEENGKGKKRPGILSAQGQSSDTHSKRSEAEGVLLENIKKNKISKVLFLSQKALLFYKKDPSNGDTKKMLEEARALMEKAGLEEKRLVSASAETRSEVENSNRPPPPPVLLSRNNHCLTFTPAPYCLEEKVCWYRIYGREAEGVNLKVRIGDSHLIGTGETIPSRGERLFRVSGLQPNQKYVFAVSAYDAQGSLVGKGIGETTRPILASLPLPLLTAWAHLAQVAYQTCQYEVAKKACSEIWSHFTLPSVSQQPVDEEDPERLAQTRLCPGTMKLSSRLLQQLFLTSIFMQTDIHIQEKALYCDSLSDGNPLIWGQESRLEECERMLLAIDLALHLNDSSAALQAVVTCYSLLMPLIYYQIPSNPVIQVLLKCLMVLQEIPGVLKERRPVATAECLCHMVSCITYYVAKGLQAFKEYNMASLVTEQGKKLLQEMSEGLQQPHNKLAPVEQEGVENLQKKFTDQIKALEGIALKHKKVEMPANLDLTAGNEAAGCNGVDLSGQEDTSVLYTVVWSSPLNIAFKDVMKFKRKSCFMEFAALLLQRALQEDQLELLLKWGQEIFSWLNRRDEGLTLPNKPLRQSVKVQNKYTSSVIEYSNKNQKVSKSDKKLTALQTKAPSGPGTQYFKKEPKAWESLLKHLGLLTSRRQRRKRLRQVCLEESPWLCHINLILAQAHLSLLRKGLRAQNVTSIQHSKLPLHSFSLAHTGTLVKWHNIPQHIKPPELSSAVLKANSQPKIRPYLQTVAPKGKDNIHDAPNPSGEGSVESEENSEMDSLHTQPASDSEYSEPTAAISHIKRTHSQILDTMCKASIHLRRAMVLAHRHGLWTFLQWACGVVWDQFRTIALLVECSESAESSSDPMLDQFYIVFTPLLVLASEVLMDMMEKLQQWKVYDENGKDLEIGPPSGDVLVDLGWLKNLILHSLELLCNQAKWETLVHLALLYNSYTRDHYTHIITPVLVHAQRKLQERISYFGGPPAPQPHFTHTEVVTGEKITCRNYAGKQLFLHWSISKKNSHGVTASNEASESLQLAEMKRAMCVASVPLDIDDTLRCFRESLAKRDYTLQTFQHSRKLLMLLLAGTQHTKQIPFCKESSFGSQDRVDFDMAASTAPSVGPPDMSSEDYSSLDSVYCLPLDHSHIQTVISSYNSSIKYLKANNYTSLQVQALHDLGNLHYYNGNQKAAHSHWSKALDCILQSTRVLESWDGDTWSGSSSQQPLKHVGIRGCLQGALLSAKIAQYILTTNITQRTQCCLLSAKLFKCLLRASLPHPETDLEYSYYSLNNELIPGVDVWSDSNPGLAGDTVASLSFLCHWLYTSGHYLRALPLLALYHYVSSKVCQHLHHTVSCRILKVKVLTELGLFAEAVREIHNLSFGEDVPLPHGGHTKADKTEALRRFSNYESLMDPSNIQVLEELVNGRPSEDLMALYGTKLSHRILLARVQLILAMCITVHNLPEPLSEVMESQVRNPSTGGSPSGYPTMRSEDPKGLQLELKDALTQGQVKALLLSKASSQLSSQHYSFQYIHTDPEELELAVETRLLLCSISLQQGKPAYSANLAASALRLLQDSSFLQYDNPHQVLGEDMKESDPCPAVWDMPASVEALERIDCSLWLRCTLALVESLGAQIPGTAIYPGVNSSVEAARLLKQGLDKAEAWGDPDTQALLFLQSVTLNTHCGKAPEENITMLQEAVSLLSGRGALSQRSGLVLAKATLLLSELRGSGGQPLYQITQKLLQQQLTVLGEYVILKAGKGLELISTPALKNIYHPQIPLLMRTTMRLGQCLALQAMASSEEDQESDLWLSAQEVLQSALVISQALPNSDPQLEADLLYLKGTVGRILLSQSEIQYQTVIETFLKSIKLTQSHGHNLQLIHRCYMEMALIYLQQWQSINTAPAKTTSTSESIKPSAWKLVRAALCKNLTVDQTQLLLFWVCLRAATKTTEACMNCGQLCGMTGATEGSLPLRALKALPDFAYNDLLNPCGDMEDLIRVGCSKDSDKESELTWVHLSRYYLHLLNLRHISTQSITGHHVEYLSASSNASLTLKLAQLHTFFSGYLAGYKEQYGIPDPPAALILEPKTTQLSHTVKRAVCQPKQLVPDLYPWASLNTQQLCIQWYQPTLAPSGVPPNMTMLVFAMNKAPLSAMRPSVLALAMLEAGQRLISTESLKALHSQLVVACAEVEIDHTVHALPVTSMTTSVTPKPENSKSPDKQRPSNKSPQEKVMLEKMRSICTEIRDLLQPDLKAQPFTEVPSEYSVQTLRDLERCFNPATGATVEDRALSDWLFSLLI